MKFAFIVLHIYLCVHSFIYGDFNTRLTAPFELGLQNWSILLQKFDRQLLDSAEPTGKTWRLSRAAAPRWGRSRGGCGGAGRVAVAQVLRWEGGEGDLTQ